MVVTDWHFGRRLGTQELHVTVSRPSDLANESRALNQKVVSLEKKNASLKEEMHNLHAKSHLRKLRNVAAHVIKVAFGEELRKTKHSQHVKQRGAQDDSVRAFAGALQVEPETLMRAADRIITRRNRDAHPNDIAELDDDVEEMASLITPALEAMAEWECLIIQRYAAIKLVFPELFCDAA
ncbi:hypothetical protein HYH03_012151 [Edaphochlamys debaryana]|uniref:DUF4145 domain-containing protein n=1 Tax=Edaphochlamys debaryana TaxID=47281 RepID=A0A835Y1C7_9CHLO|nr:hypothetical protein HYH03_012151 [Edaphochlamys debaryana]|eukprot:KAG2489319.1 hypothetical protein HYH03_012151 [Edaphochlamys debaryana]